MPQTHAAPREILDAAHAARPEASSAESDNPRLLGYFGGLLIVRPSDNLSACCLPDVRRLIGAVALQDVPPRSAWRSSSPSAAATLS
jgi:hypothetical protein